MAEELDYLKTISETDKAGINNSLGPIKTYFSLLKEYENTPEGIFKDKIKSFLDSEAKNSERALKNIERILGNR